MEKNGTNLRDGRINQSLKNGSYFKSNILMKTLFSLVEINIKALKICINISFLIGNFKNGQNIRRKKE